MPRFISFQNDVIFPDLGQPFKVSGFFVANEPTGVPLQEPFAWDSSLAPFSGVSGISYFAEAASGQFISMSPRVTWSVLDSVTERPLTDDEMQSSTNFKGFNISLLDETGLLIKDIVTGYRSNYIDLETDDLIDLFGSVYGDPDLS